MNEQRALSVLHILPAVRPTNAQYHEHCLPMRHKRRIVICSLLSSTLAPPPPLELIAGDGSRRGAWRALRAALKAEPYDIIHAHVPITGALLAAAMVASRRSMSSCVFSMTNSYGSYRRRNQLLLYPIFALFPQLVLCSAAVKESLPLMLARLARNKATVVLNGVDTERVDEVLASLPDSGSDIGRRAGMTLVSVGRLIDIKDPHTLVAAFAAFARPGDRLVFVGDGPLRDDIMRWAEQAGVGSQVEITGFVPREDVYRRVVSGDVCVAVSLGEGLPCAVLESMACGRPVILSDIPPHREIADEVDFVPFVATGDVEGLVRELVRVRSMSAQERLDVGDQCQKLVSARYSVAAMHTALEPVYRRAARHGDDEWGECA